MNGGAFTIGDIHGISSNKRQLPTEVSVDDFYIGETVVTQELWEAVVGSNPSKFKGQNRPIENITWYDAQKFICKLNELTNENFRLPTEAEWEFAARERGKDDVIFGDGSRVADVKNINFHSSREYLTDRLYPYIDGGEHFIGETVPVKSYLPNSLGIYELSGNVNEWCQDWGNGVGDYKGGHNPKGEFGGYKISRGGSWQCNLFLVTASNRHFDNPNSSSPITGFRLAI